MKYRKTYFIKVFLPDDVVSVDENVLGGQLVLKNTRIPVDVIFDYISKGWSTSELPMHFPGIDISLVEKLIKYQGGQLQYHGGKEKTS